MPLNLSHDCELSSNMIVKTLAVHGFPDAQLISYGEMQAAAATVSESLSSIALELGTEPIPCIADGDTGYGNAVRSRKGFVKFPTTRNKSVMLTLLLRTPHSLFTLTRST